MPHTISNAQELVVRLPHVCAGSWHPRFISHCTKLGATCTASFAVKYGSEKLGPFLMYSTVMQLMWKMGLTFPRQLCPC